MKPHLNGKPKHFIFLVATLLAFGVAAAQSAQGQRSRALPSILTILLDDATGQSPRVVALNTDLQSPWGMAFLPDGRILITQKAGQLLILSTDYRQVETQVSGVPQVNATGQGGLLDVALDPDFDTSPYIYLTYSESGTGAVSGLSGTAVARGRLTGKALVTMLFLVV